MSIKIFPSPLLASPLPICRQAVPTEGRRIGQPLSNLNTSLTPSHSVYDIFDPMNQPNPIEIGGIHLQTVLVMSLPIAQCFSFWIDWTCPSGRCLRGYVHL
jgi:hypothetical protein